MAITDSKKEAFINAFILTGCKEGTKAAIKAGYSQKTAAQQASRLLKDVKVQQAIESQKKLATKLFIKSKEQKLLLLEEMQGDNAPTETVNTHNINKVDDDSW